MSPFQLPGLGMEAKEKKEKGMGLVMASVKSLRLGDNLRPPSASTTHIKQRSSMSKSSRTMMLRFASELVSWRNLKQDG